MKVTKQQLCTAISYLLVQKVQLEYCLVCYDELNKELDDTLDKCNYFGDKV